MEHITQAICKEITLRKSELNEPLQSIYFGGGTPSLLPQIQLNNILQTIEDSFSISPLAEITLEANPDDITKEGLDWIKKTAINRFSLGVQSFFDEDLIWMNRAHKASDAEQSILMIQDAGFSKTTIDLIYGGPTLTHDHWQKNMEKAVSLGLKHISAYGLTVEPQTALNHKIATGKVVMPQEEHLTAQFEMLMCYLASEGFEQYEISNFAKNQQYAVHNTAYWFNKPYLGIGPSAHSFNGSTRSWNIANNQQYVKAINKQELPLEIEYLSPENKINEYIMTGLRTIWGCSWDTIEQRFGEKQKLALQQRITPFVSQKQIVSDNEAFKLTKTARILADGIASALFF